MRAALLFTILIAMANSAPVEHRENSNEDGRFDCRVGVTCQRHKPSPTDRFPSVRPRQQNPKNQQVQRESDYQQSNYQQSIKPIYSDDEDLQQRQIKI